MPLALIVYPIYLAALADFVLKKDAKMRELEKNSGNLKTVKQFGGRFCVIFGVLLIQDYLNCNKMTRTKLEAPKHLVFRIS